MAVDFATLIAVAPYPEEQRRTILANVDKLTNEQKRKLTDTGWFALLQLYAARVKYVRDKLLLEIAEGKRKFNREDFEGIEEEAVIQLAQHLRTTSSASQKSIEGIAEEVRNRFQQLKE